MLHFLKKAEKITAALGALPPNPRWPPSDECSAARPPSCYSHSI